MIQLHRSINFIWRQNSSILIIDISIIVIKLKPYIITQIAVNMVKWNLVHMFLGTIRMKHQDERWRSLVIIIILFIIVKQFSLRIFYNKWKLYFRVILYIALYIYQLITFNKLINYPFTSYRRLCSRQLFENMATKEEIAQNKQFFLLSSCFQLLYFHLKEVSKQF